MLLCQALDLVPEAAEEAGTGALVSGLAHAEQQAVEQVSSTFKRSVSVAKWWMQATCEEATEEHSITFTRRLRKVLLALREGAPILPPSSFQALK